MQHIRHALRSRFRPRESSTYDIRIDTLSELARDRFIVHRANEDRFFRGRFRQSAPELYGRARDLLNWEDEA